MARCSLFAALKYNKSIKKGDKPGCNCFKMPAMPTKKVKKISIPVPNYMFDTWEMMGSMYLELYNQSFKIAVHTAIEKMSQEEDDPNEEEWEKNLPVQYSIEIVPAMPQFFNL